MEKVPAKFTLIALEGIADLIIKKDFPLLKNVKIMYILRHKEKYDGDNLILGEASRLSNKIRDIFHYDFMIEFYKNAWEQASDDQKKRMLWHELCHCGIEQDSDFNLVHDDCGRLKVFMKDHDINIQTFKEEIDKFGVALIDYHAIDLLRDGLDKKINILDHFREAVKEMQYADKLQKDFTQEKRIKIKKR